MNADTTGNDDERRETHQSGVASGAGNQADELLQSAGCDVAMDKVGRSPGMRPSRLVRIDRITLVYSLIGTYSRLEDAISDLPWFTEHDRGGLYLVL